MNIVAQTWYLDIFRSIFATLDKMVYGAIKWSLFGIFDLSNLSTNSDVFSGIYSRIYVILGIFMAFKLSFSFFQYLIDPESMTGKSEKSISKVCKYDNNFISLGLRDRDASDCLCRYAQIINAYLSFLSL